MIHAVAPVTTRGRLRVKLRRAQPEQMFSGVPLLDLSEARKFLATGYQLTRLRDFATKGS
jgi:hypothetical protein